MNYQLSDKAKLNSQGEWSENQWREMIQPVRGTTPAQSAVMARVAAVSEDPHHSWDERGLDTIKKQTELELAEAKKQKKLKGMWNQVIEDQLEEMGSGEFYDPYNMTDEKKAQIEAQKVGSNAYQNQKFEGVN